MITGGAGGLGAVAAKRLYEEGARVVISDVNEERGEEVARRMDPDGKRVIAVACDISRPADNENLIREAERFFEQEIDIFLANAGAGFSGSLLDASVEQIRRTIDINVTGSLLSAQSALRSLVKGPSSSLIFTCSLQGVTARSQRSVYTASKHAIVGMMKALALEFGAQGVRVNAISPAATDTPFLRNQLAGVTTNVEEAMSATEKSLPLGHLPDAGDFAEAVLYLSSAQAKSITGHNLLIDCGASAGKF
ncbi:SDR family oxidoreductase [Polaromonas hydrogenivorans]|uniref:SDR family oxidoreductase n=1 Tax=Polaromonas hydrogenivorans TaxID=335476 RepID=A0AAU7LY13_9BURK